MSLLPVLLLAACTPKPILEYTLDTPPLALVPAADVGVTDQRGRFREILCAVAEAHGQQLPDYRPCQDILHRLADEPPGGGEPVRLGPARVRLRVAVVPGLGAECVAALTSAFPFALEHIERYGYETATIAVEGLSSSTRNAAQVRDAVMSMDLAPDEKLVLVGYSKGAPDILAALVAYPELQDRVTALVSIAGAVNGSPLSDDAPESALWWLQNLPGAECAAGDSGAIESLKRTERVRFMAEHRLPETVRYYSLAAFAERDQISFVIRGSYDKLALIDPRNDSQVIFYDAIIPGSALLGYLNGDQWALALPIAREHPTLAATLVTRNAFPREVLLEAVVRHVEEQLLAAPAAAPAAAPKKPAVSADDSTSPPTAGSS